MPPKEKEKLKQDKEELEKEIYKASNAIKWREIRNSIIVIATHGNIDSFLESVKGGFKMCLQRTAREMQSNWQHDITSQINDIWKERVDDIRKKLKGIVEIIISRYEQWKEEKKNKNAK